MSPMQKDFEIKRGYFDERDGWQEKDLTRSLE